jgi:hypothetical protein
MLVSVLLVLIITTFSFSFFDNNEKSDEEEVLGFCGTVNDVFYLDEKDKEFYLSGKDLFKYKCAMCHNKNMKDDMTGPALGGALSRWENDTIKITTYLNNPKKYISESKDARIQAMHIKYGKCKKPDDKNYTQDEISAILAYIDLVK